LLAFIDLLNMLDIFYHVFQHSFSFNSLQLGKYTKDEEDLLQRQEVSKTYTSQGHSIQSWKGVPFCTR